MMMANSKVLPKPPEPIDRSIPPEEHQRVENTWTGCPASHADPENVNQRTSLHALLFCNPSHHGFHMWLIEGLDRG